MLTARDFIIFIWGAALASGIWATCWWNGVPIGTNTPEPFPVVGFVTVLAAASTAFLWIRTLVIAALDEKE